MSRRRLKMEVVQQADGQWFPRIRAGNGEKWWSAEASKRKSDAKRRIFDFLAALGVVYQPGEGIGYFPLVESPTEPSEPPASE